MYSDWMIHSPAVPVFRDDDTGALLDTPYLASLFANDPAVVARAFAAELAGDFAGRFDEVVFAVLDWSEERRFVRPFVEKLLS